ncbi:MAG TPA: hypothetical protein DCP03_12435 [Polaromonas sp.]|nr:hypothetical protein [Polaromonas sp.]
MLEEVGQEIAQLIVRVAQGETSKSEEMSHQEFILIPGDVLDFGLF